MKRLLFSALSIFLVGAPVVADDEADVYEMGEIIITGSKLPQTPGNVTQKISIITADEIGSLVLGNGNLAEMLSYSPGNFANVLSRNDANWGSSGVAWRTPTRDTCSMACRSTPSSISRASIRGPSSGSKTSAARPRCSIRPIWPMDFAGNQSPLAGDGQLHPQGARREHPHQCLSLLRLLQHHGRALLPPTRPQVTCTSSLGGTTRTRTTPTTAPSTRTAIEILG